MDSTDTLKEEVYRANMLLPQYGLVTFTFGNASGIDRESGIIAIKPSGIPYKELSPDAIVIVDLNGKVLEGSLNPSSDTKTHIVLYKHFPETGGIVHTHSTYATSWAQAMRPIPCYGTTHADYVNEEIPCTEMLTDKQINADYETETGLMIVKTFDSAYSREAKMVLAAGHGPFTWGSSPLEAAKNSVILEELARTALFTEQLSPDTKPLKKSLVDKHYFRKHGKNAYYGQK